MIKINSELPNCLLNKNEEINEFDFVLFHLCESDEKYKNHFMYVRYTQPKRLMILDNSAYEYYIKGETLDLDKFINCIFELEPDYYILPDTLMDRRKTLTDTVKFMFKMAGRGECKSKPLAVVQGKTVEEMLQCLDTYETWGIENISIPFHNSFFKELGVHTNEDIQNEFMETYGVTNDDILYAMGRVQFVRDYEHILKRFKYVHFLGSHCPLEKVFYKDYDSMDTGYPVKLAIMGDLLFEEKSKPNIIIDEFLNDELDIETKELIEINVEKFKKL
jgi:hypothetical protein